MVFIRKTFTNDARLIGDSIHMLRMGLRDIKQPFYLARMMVSDEIKSRTKMTQVCMHMPKKGASRIAAPPLMMWSRVTLGVQVGHFPSNNGRLALLCVQQGTQESVGMGGYSVYLLRPERTTLCEKLVKFPIPREPVLARSCLFILRMLPLRQHTSSAQYCSNAKAYRSTRPRRHLVCPRRRLQRFRQT